MFPADTPLGDDVAAWVKDNYGAGQSWVDLGTYRDKDGAEKFFAFPYKADLKSLVWYVPDNFDEAGYEIPKTWEELQELTEQIVATLGVNRTNFETDAAESTTTALTGGIKYYFTQVARRGLVPFAEAAIGVAMVDTGVDDSTDLTWEVGGGAAYFISEATSIDASLRWYQTDTDGGDTEGIRLFIGMTTRF